MQNLKSKMKSIYVCRCLTMEQGRHRRKTRKDFWTVTNWAASMKWTQECWSCVDLMNFLQVCVERQLNGGSKITDLQKILRDGCVREGGMQKTYASGSYNAGYERRCSIGSYERKIDATAEGNHRFGTVAWRRVHAGWKEKRSRSWQRLENRRELERGMAMAKLDCNEAQNYVKVEGDYWAT